MSSTTTTGSRPASWTRIGGGITHRRPPSPPPSDLDVSDFFGKAAHEHERREPAAAVAPSSRRRTRSRSGTTSSSNKTVLTPPSSLPVSPPLSPTVQPIKSPVRASKAAAAASHQARSESAAAAAVKRETGAGSASVIGSGAKAKGGQHSRTSSSSKAEVATSALGRTSPTPSNASASSSRRRTRVPAEIDDDDDEEDESANLHSIQKRYNLKPTSPILPKVKLAFPTILSDEEDAWHPSPSPPPSIYAASSPPPVSTSSPKTPRESGKRTWSSTTTTTTRRTWTYSMPSVFDPHALGLDDDVAEFSERRHARVASAATSPRKLRTSSPAAPPSSPTSNSGWITGPPSAYGSPHSTRTRSYAGPSLSSSAYHRARSPSTGTSKRPSVSTSQRSSSSKPTHGRKTSLNRSSAPSSFRTGAAFSSAGPSTMFSKYGSRTLTTTPQFAAPVFSAFAFLIVSTMACLAIGSVLLSSLALTFYDDCGKRAIYFQKGIAGGTRRIRGSIEGVRYGMERMVGGARGALELVVWAAGARALPTIILDNVELDLEGEEYDEVVDQDATPPTPPSENESAPRGRAPTSRDTRTMTPPPTRSFRDHTRRVSSTSDDSGSWTEHEEDNFPYTVPCTTPHPSRPASPSRSDQAQREKQQRQQQQQAKLPPRPALSLLIPSIIFALMYTICTVLANFRRKPSSSAKTQI